VSTFEKLTFTITEQERLQLLEKLAIAPNYDDDQLVSSSETEAYDLSEEKATLLPYERFKLFFLNIFSGGKAYNNLLQDHLLTKKCKEITQSFPLFVNFEAKYYLPAFYDSLIDLAVKLSLLKKPLNNAFNRRRGEFYAFLAGEENPQIHQELMAMNPAALAARHNYDNVTLREVIKAGCNQLTSKMISEHKASIRPHIRSLALLEQLANYNFDKVINSFIGSKTASYAAINSYLKEINAILYSLQYPPAIKLLERLFLFNYKCEDINDNDIIASLKEDLPQALEAIAAIKNFNRFPLTKVIRVLEDDYFYQPNLLTGGEDWAALYQKFWLTRTAKAFNFFALNQKCNEQAARIAHILNESQPPLLPYYNNQSWPKDLPASYQYSLALINGFFTKIYQNYELKIVKPLFEQGNFYKKNGKAALAEASEMLLRVQEKLADFTANLSKDGELAIIFLPSSTALNGAEIKEKQKAAADMANRLALAITQYFLDTLNLLTLIFNGLIKGDLSGSQFDTISNMHELDAAISKFREKVVATYEQCSLLSATLFETKDTEERLAALEDNA